MHSKLLLPRIYPITDTRLSGISHVEQTKRLIAGGATLIQLRDKHAPPREFYFSALDAVHIARDNGVKIIVNDRVDVAIAVGADGVHLGQDDIPPEKARALLGRKVIIGFSAHTIEQVEAALKLDVDYIAFGPIFRTETKAHTEPVVGLEGLRIARQAAGSKPLVAIGGIDGSNVVETLNAGAYSAAIIGAIVSEADNIVANMKRFHALRPA